MRINLKHALASMATIGFLTTGGVAAMAAPAGAMATVNSPFSEPAFSAGTSSAKGAVRIVSCNLVSSRATAAGRSPSTSRALATAGSMLDGRVLALLHAHDQRHRRDAA